MQIYVIQSGDSLWQIARRFGVTIDALQQLNQLPDPNRLVVGQAILIPPTTTIESLAYFQLSNMSALERSLVTISPYITYGAMFHYPVNSDASLTISANTERAGALLKRFQIRPLIVITNVTTGIGFDPDLARTVLGTATLRRQLINNILTLLDQYGLEGVNVDFENLNPADRSLYTAFIQELSTALNSNGYLSTIAVAPKAADLPNAAWVGAFDYAALGAAANLVYLMTYEWGWVGGPPMAIAPLNQVQRVIEYASSLIPPQKLIQGVPLYGYDWTLPDTPENVAATVNLNAVYDLAYNFQAAIEYNLTAQSPWFIYSDAAGVRHEVWFEDVRSVRAKYQLARDFNLRGVGFWSPVNEPYGFAQNWAVLAETFDVV
jgi:spore germination protein